MKKLYIKKRIVKSTLLFIFLLALCYTVQTKSLSKFNQDNNSISGFVFGIDRQPLADTPVELLDDFNRFISRTKTNSSGRYEFFRLSQGRFSIRVLPIRTDYQEQTKEIEIVNLVRQSNSGRTIVSGIENKQVDFYLVIKRNSNNVPRVNGVVFAQEVPKEAQKAYEKGLSELRDDNKKEAIGNFLRALDIFPDYFLALKKLGHEYVEQKNFADARSILNRAVIVNPKSFDSWYELAYAQNALKDYSESINSLKQAIVLNSGSINALYLISLSQKQIGNYQEALDNLKKAKKIANPPPPEIYWQLALLYTNNFKDYAAAVQELELFLKVKPDYEEADKVRELIKKLKAKEKS